MPERSGMASSLYPQTVLTSPANILLLAMTFGFRIALLTGAVLYFCAFILLSRDSAWRESAPIPVRPPGFAI